MCDIERWRLAAFQGVYSENRSSRPPRRNSNSVDIFFGKKAAGNAVPKLQNFDLSSRNKSSVPQFTPCDAVVANDSDAF